MSTWARAMYEALTIPTTVAAVYIRSHPDSLLILKGTNIKVYESMFSKEPAIDFDSRDELDRKEMLSFLGGLKTVWQHLKPDSRHNSPDSAAMTSALGVSYETGIGEGGVLKICGNVVEANVDGYTFISDGESYVSSENRDRRVVHSHDDDGFGAALDEMEEVVGALLAGCKVQIREDD